MLSLNAHSLAHTLALHQPLLLVSLHSGRPSRVLPNRSPAPLAFPAAHSPSAPYPSQDDTSVLTKALRPRRIKQLCLGAFHSAALTDQGDVYTWGDGRWGATGLDLSRQEVKLVSRPTRVLGLGGARNNVTVLASGVKHLLAVTEDGHIYSWGEGSHGRLGHGDHTTVRRLPHSSTLAFIDREAPRLRAWRAHTCVWSWMPTCLLAHLP